MTTTTTCRDCDRLLTNLDSVARGRGQKCQRAFDGGDHSTPTPRRPARQRQHADDVPFPGFLEQRGAAVIENSEAAGILDAAGKAARDVDPATVRAIVVAAMHQLDSLIVIAHEDDLDWPAEGDLPRIFADSTTEGTS